MGRYIATPVHEDRFVLDADSDEEAIATITAFNNQADRPSSLRIVKLEKRVIETIWEEGK